MSEQKDLNELRKRLEELDQVQVRRNRYYWWLLLIPFFLGIAYVVWTSRQADVEAGKLAVVKGEEIARDKVAEVETLKNKEIDGLLVTVASREETINEYRSGEEDLVAAFAKQFPDETGVTSMYEVADALERLEVSGSGSDRPSCSAGLGCYPDSIWTQYLNLKDLWKLEKAAGAARSDSLALLRARVVELDSLVALRNAQVDYLIYRLEYERSITARLAREDREGQKLSDGPVSESMKLRKLRKALIGNKTPMILGKSDGALRSYETQDYIVRPEVERTQDDIRKTLSCAEAEPIVTGTYFPTDGNGLYSAPVRKFEHCP